jgi:hypothetical protein
MPKGVLTLTLSLSFFMITPIFGQKTKNSEQKQPFDYHIFYSSKDIHVVFDESHKTNLLTNKQLLILKAIINRVSDSLNLIVTSTNVNTQEIDTLKHKFQIVSAKDSKGQSVVWVNALCDKNKDWRRQLVFVDDGGNCYYHFKINLSEKRYYSIAINTEE